jgi:hypothetical protein
MIVGKRYRWGGKPKTFEADELGPCPSCGQMIAYTEFGENSQERGLTHPLPMCAYFEKTSVQQIVHDMYEGLKGTN